MAKLVGQNYTTPDLVAKVTGRAKYAEDFRVEGMLFAKLLLSARPHARVDEDRYERALAMPGVKGILTQDDLPAVVEGANLGEGIIASSLSERGLTNEPMYVGEPILAVAAVDELTAAEAIETHRDRVRSAARSSPIRSRACAPAAPTRERKATSGCGRSRRRRCPVNRPHHRHSRRCRNGSGPRPTSRRRRTVSCRSARRRTSGRTVTSTPRSSRPTSCSTRRSSAPTPAISRSRRARAMAYWLNGKLYMHCSTQSTMRTISAVARWVGIEPKDVVIISEYTGGGFGSKGSSSVFTVIPALLSKKVNAPVMMRITREEEQYIGRARPAFHSRIRAGFRKDGRLLAVDGLVIVDNGPYDVVSDSRSGGDHISLANQPEAMRWRMITVLTNTPPRGAQRAPGGMQGNGLDGAAAGEGGAQAGHRRGRAAPHQRARRQGRVRPGRTRRAAGRTSTSAFVKQAIDKGAELFKWEERKARSGKREGSKVRGVGMAVSCYSAGSMGFDGLLVIKPDGRVAIQSGIGNLGTESVFDCHRVAAEIIGVPWEKVDVTWGNTSKFVPNTCGQGGSQTTHAMTRAAHAAGTDAKTKLQKIAATALGGRPEDYDVANERVFHKGGGRGMSLADAAKRADPAWRCLRRPRAAGEHQRVHQDLGHGACRARA